MLTQEKVMEILRKELPYFASEYGVKRIGLFGSYAKGIQGEDSDIDILVEFAKPIGLKFVEFGEYLEKLLGRKTDILTPAGIDGIRIKKVAKNIRENIVYV
ncbi:MAG TPA: nucleotidyltransferase [Phycisphaerales bacterium]|nr:nucleotidyltransferase [Phycisphaerales bacterium]